MGRPEGSDLRGRCIRAVSLDEAQRWADRIGPRLRVLRRSLEVGCDELAAAIGVPLSLIYRWEVSERRIPLRRVYQLAAALGVLVSDLLEDG